jgi:hypothetical protein
VVTHVGPPRIAADDRRVAAIALPRLDLAAVLPGLAALSVPESNWQMILAVLHGTYELAGGYSGVPRS